MVGFQVAFAFFFIAVIAVMMGLLILGLYQHHQRREMWRALGRKYGLRYSESDPFHLPHSHLFHLFQTGHSKRAYNCLFGEHRGRRVVFFDYQYSTGSGKSESTHYLSALLVQLDIVSPPLVIRPESFWDRLGSIFGLSDINFEYEAFNRAFHVTSADKKFAYDICHPQMMEYLLDWPHLSWELAGKHLLLYSWSLGNFDEQELAECLEAADGFLERIPNYLQSRERV